ncbi:MAG TPA: hypothetical protein VJX10_20870, partial [Pseudonocardiaceae bacterium]|nr:hypothetical protein [Pseudonocardiaceae bacterium]
TGPNPMAEPAPPTPARPDLMAPEPATVRTWQPPTPPRPYQVAYAGPPAAPAWRRRLLTAVAIIVAALIGILVANTFVDTSGDNSGAAAATTTPDPSVLNAPLPSALPTFSAPPVVTVTPTTTAQPTTQAGKVQAQQELSVLHAYLGLLPDHPGQAFALLTPAEQARSGGLAGYLATWHMVKRVELGNTSSRDGTIVARVKVTPRVGRTTDNAYRFAFAQQNGTLLINGITQVSHSRHD